MREWVTSAKNFANIYADLCWVHIISPEVGRCLLHELIETVPGNKITAFGGDEVAVEMALWDIVGKKLNTPIYNLLRGKCRDSVRTYLHIQPRTEVEPGLAHGMEKGETSIRTVLR